MQKFNVREVASKKDLKRFITFVDELYEGCDQFVPPLHKGQEHDLMKAAPLAYCTRKMWIAEDADGKREWPPTPIFLPGEFHGPRSLVGYSPWGHKEPT